jgi:hypothetical protein
MGVTEGNILYIGLAVHGICLACLGIYLIVQKLRQRKG